MTVIVRIAWVLAVVVLLSMASIFGGSEWILRRRHGVALEGLPPMSRAASSAEGRRRAVLIGCLEGCHGPAGISLRLIPEEARSRGQWVFRPGERQ